MIVIVGREPGTNDKGFANPSVIEKTTRLASGPCDPTAAGCSVESEFDRDSGVARV